MSAPALAMVSKQEPIFTPEQVEILQAAATSFGRHLDSIINSEVVGEEERDRFRRQVVQLRTAYRTLDAMRP